MVLNAAVQMLKEADELKEKIIKFKNGTSMLQDLSIWTTQQQLQKVYQKLLVLDLDYALDKKVEQDLWNIGFKQQIEALQAVSKDRKNPLRSEGQGMLSWVLQVAAGFYLCLLHQLCTTFKLDLPFRRRASLLGWVEGWGAGERSAGARLPAAGAARYICQHCLVHLGDLARYKQQLRVAHSFYRQAVSVWAHSGQPYNQLALVASRRAHRLPALYWQVRALLVRAPFPPAPANLTRTLRAAASSQTSRDLPVLPGITSTDPEKKLASIPGRLDAHSYITDLIRALHLIHTVEELCTAASLVTSLNSSLTALIATDSFESATLIKMACVVMWAVHSSTEELTTEAVSEGEAEAGELSCALAAGALLALLLPAYSAERPPERALPPLKVWLQWTVSHPQILRSGAWSSRAALWPALAHTLNLLAEKLTHADAGYETVPLPEDEELHGFLPLEAGFKGLRFHNHAAWDTYGGRVPDIDTNDDCDSDLQSPSETAVCFTNEPQLEERVRAHRLVELGKRLAQLRPEHFSYTEVDGLVRFTAASAGGEQLSLALAELSAARAARGEGAQPTAHSEEGEEDSDEEPVIPPPPIIISEADFREKVREKRVGILKPQGSLERAREERAQATTIEEQDTDTTDDNSKSDDKKEARKPRVNIAMAAIMRKQEETNKQVKFVTPPPTPDSTVDNTEVKDQEKPKMIQPKPVKSLTNLPLGRKTGGILSLKDKSAGYPHLVNANPEPQKKPEKEEKKEPKLSQNNSQGSQTYQQKRQEHVPAPNWTPNQPNYNESPRMALQKNYGIQSSGISYNPTYQPNGNQGIRLPVVNPKEIDVRTAALQKQNSRQDVFQDGTKFGNQGYQMSGDKKNFLNDLPPRFANQYRYWQSAQENQLNENKFKDDTFKPDNTLFNSQQRPNWPESYQQPMQWWKPDNSPNFNTNYSMNVQPNYFAPPMNANIPNPYQSVPFNPPLNNLGQQNKPENLINQGYHQPTIGQPQLQTLQNLVTSPSFNSSLAGYDAYGSNVSYDSSMYPNFGNKLGYQPLQMKMQDKPQVGYQGNKDLMDIGVGFGSNVIDMQQRNFPVKFNEQLNELGASKNMEHIGMGERPITEGPGSTYSLFSGAPDSAAGPWGSAQRHPAPQSLWSGPGPSPLERLLEQQKQMKQPPAPQ